MSEAALCWRAFLPSSALVIRCGCPIDPARPELPRRVGQYRGLPRLCTVRLGYAFPPVDSHPEGLRRGL